jgi:hypothetical protein
MLRMLRGGFVFLVAVRVGWENGVLVEFMGLVCISLGRMNTNCSRLLR